MSFHSSIRSQAGYNQQLTWQMP